MKVASKVSGWLLFVNTLPGQNPTLRIRIWRALKGIGAAVLRDGVYLLPKQNALIDAIEELKKEIIQNGGSAHYFLIQDQSEEQNQEFLALFDRSESYAEILQSAVEFKKKFKRIEESEMLRRYRQLKRTYLETVALDYFPGAAKDQAEGALVELEIEMNRVISPEEPLPASIAIQKLDLAEYQGRKWATRQHPWVDRLASAWLIRRFIDPKADILWLKRPSDCPKRALGFDFDGAPFTHIGARVTFEVLLASFNLEEDQALKRLGSLVHYLDIGGIQVPEAAGFESMVAGARNKCLNDDDLLKEVSKVLDFLYSSFTDEVSRVKLSRKNG